MNEVKKIKSAILIRNGLVRNLPRLAKKGELLVTLDNGQENLYVGTGTGIVKVTNNTNKSKDISLSTATTLEQMLVDHNNLIKKLSELGLVNIV